MSDFKEVKGLYKREVWESGYLFKWAIHFYVVGLAWYKIAEQEHPTTREKAMRESQEAFQYAIDNELTDQNYDLGEEDETY